jgi:hypothetical protein
MSAVMSEAENKFFSSGGSDVAPELKPADAPPETPAPATTPTPAPATTTAPAVAEPTQQQVPLAALHEERQKRARAEQERQALQERIRQFEEVIAQAQKAQQAPPPDPNVDPIGAALHQSQATQKELEDMRQWRASQEQATQHQNLRQQFTQAVANSEATFRTTHPDYDQAFNHASQQYDKMLRAMIPDPVARRQRVIQEANGVALQLLQEGRDPAQFFYDFAKEMGYTGAQAAAATAVTQPLAAAVIPQTTSEVVKTIERGLKQQGNSGGGGATPGEITPEMALNLPAAEYNKWWTKQFKR